MSRPLRGTTGVTALAVALAAALALGWTAWQWVGAEPPAPGVKLAAAPTPAPTSAPAVAPSGIGHGARLAPETAASTASAPAAAPSAPAAPRDERFKGIGSEGFGPHVQRALDSGDPRQALDAARWIAGCRPDMDVESMINGSHPKYRLVLPADQQAEVITNERQNQRFCQTLTPDLMAQHRALALRALEAKVPGSGLAYYQSLDLEKRSPDELERALQGLRADAEHGQEMAVPLLAAVKLGQSRVEQLAYTKLMDLLMLKNILPPASGLGMPPSPPVPYTAQEQADAAALLKRLWPRFVPPG